MKYTMTIYKVTYYDIRKTREKYVEKTYKNAGVAFYGALQIFRENPNLHSIGISRVNVDETHFQSLEDEKKKFLENVIEKLF